MHSRLKWSVCLLGLAAMFVAAGVPARAQDKQHVVSLGDLNKDAARPAETRQANEEAVRTLLSSDQGQKALKSAKLDYQKVDKAVGQLSDADLARLAERSRQAQADFQILRRLEQIAFLTHDRPRAVALEHVHRDDPQRRATLNLRRRAAPAVSRRSSRHGR